MTQEEWRPVAGFEGKYEVSNFGMVRSLDRIVLRSGPKGSYYTRRGRILKPITSTCGYLEICLGRGPLTTELRVGIHILVLEAFVCPMPYGLETRHRDGNPKNNNLTNLQWGTPKENSEDKKRHGTMPQGELHSRHKLSADDVIKIRALCGPARVIADRFGIGETQVYRIRKFESWKHLHSDVESRA